MIERLKAIFAEYGPIAFVVYVLIFVGTLAGFYLAIHAGLQPEGFVAGAGTMTGAYLATKVTQPVRIGATALVTPFAARIWLRLRGDEQTPPP